MKPEELKEGEIYWCISAMRESDTKSPVKPWQGKLRNWEHGCGNMFFIHRFNQETGEIDYDENASALVCSKDVFKYEDEAKKKYIEIKDILIQTKIDGLMRQKEELNEYKGSFNFKTPFEVAPEHENYTNDKCGQIGFHIIGIYEDQDVILWGGDIENKVPVPHVPTYGPIKTYVEAKDKLEQLQKNPNYKSVVFNIVHVFPDGKIRIEES